MAIPAYGLVVAFDIWVWAVSCGWWVAVSPDPWTDCVCVRASGVVVRFVLKLERAVAWAVLHVGRFGSADVPGSCLLSAAVEVSLGWRYCESEASLPVHVCSLPLAQKHWLKFSR